MTDLVNDSGLEVLRKAAEVITPSEYRLRTSNSGGSFSISGLGIGRILAMNLDDTAWVDVTTLIVAAGVTGLTSLSVQNISGNGNTVLWNYDGLALATTGWRIEDGGFRSVLIKNAVDSIVYVRILSGLGRINVEGLAP